MPWVDSRPGEWIEKYLGLENYQAIQNILFGRDCVILAGSPEADEVTRAQLKDKFVIQLNHHLRRRKHQPAHWLITRAGCGFKPEEVKEVHLDSLKIVSAAINKDTADGWAEWCDKHGKKFYPFHEASFVKLNPFHMNLEWCNTFWHEIMTNPYAGMMALAFCLHFPIHTVDLVGFDFFQQPGGGWDAKRGCHFTFPQMRWLRDVYRTDMRVVENAQLESILNVKYRGIVEPDEFPIFQTPPSAIQD